MRNKRALALLTNAVSSLDSYCALKPLASESEKNKHISKLLDESNDPTKGVRILRKLTSASLCNISEVLHALIILQQNSNKPLYKQIYQLKTSDGLSDEGVRMVSRFVTGAGPNKKKHRKAEAEPKATEPKPRMSDSIDCQKHDRVYSLK